LSTVDAQVVLRLTHFAADVLSLLPPSAGTPQPVVVKTHTARDSSLVVQSAVTAPVQYIAKQASWPLLNDPCCFQEAFDLAMLSFEDAWRSLTDKVEELPNTETYSKVLNKCRITLWEVLAKVIKASPLLSSPPLLPPLTCATQAEAEDGGQHVGGVDEHSAA
jgi:hypothetical protein